MVPHTPTKTIKTKKKKKTDNMPTNTIIQTSKAKKTEHHLKTPIAPHFCELYFLFFLLFLLIFPGALPCESIIKTRRLATFSTLARRGRPKQTQ